ncbi:hypothetical protein D3P07_00655 [Paenibacillus sp. 1011MAR3C5]|uniref:hypothetical protein n=1 Tax=Paenibacillus sp. 1011MAR3C5 TaxID=1675787 RepID=UPI000E6C9AD7|nr:hypothetical protein [Paenibacillus sp. 1011MAR3C5]RJE90654.1 hypothetical protein D3P07_00655 [Paenibacillus sp. 1011MAR3C5]
MTKPVIYWYDSAHSAQIKEPFDFGVIDAGDESNVFTFNIWNNRYEASKDNYSDVSKMEDCTITTRDMSGGTGSINGNIVESVRDNWFHAQVDSLGETDLTESSSRIGASYSKVVGTTGTTKHRKSLTATTWMASTAYTVGQAVVPATANGFVYVCKTAGTSNAFAPTWSTISGETVNDGSVAWDVIAINHTPKAGEILGVQNNGVAANSGGNFITVTIQAQVPLTASAGRQNMKLRLSYRYV